MARKLTVGDVVQCRYHNLPEKKFYGAPFDAEIIRIQPEYEEIKYVVMRLSDNYVVVLHRQEVLKRIS